MLPTSRSAVANRNVASPTMTSASRTAKPPSEVVTRNSTSTVSTSMTTSPALLASSTANDARYAVTDLNCPTNNAQYALATLHHQPALRPALHPVAEHQQARRPGRLHPDQ